MPRRPPEQPSDLPPEVLQAVAAMDPEQLRTTTFQLLDLAGARLRKQRAPVPGAAGGAGRRSRSA